MENCDDVAKKSQWPTENKPEHQRTVKNNGIKKKWRNREKQKSEWKTYCDNLQNILPYKQQTYV